MRLPNQILLLSWATFVALVTPCAFDDPVKSDPASGTDFSGNAIEAVEAS